MRQITLKSKVKSLRTIKIIPTIRVESQQIAVQMEITIIKPNRIKVFNLFKTTKKAIRHPFRQMILLDNPQHSYNQHKS